MLDDLIKRASVGNPTLTTIEATILAQGKRTKALSRRQSRVILNWTSDPKQALRLNTALRARLIESRAAELRMHKLFMMLV